MRDAMEQPLPNPTLVNLKRLQGNGCVCWNLISTKTGDFTVSKRIQTVSFGQKRNTRNLDLFEDVPLAFFLHSLADLKYHWK